MQAITQSYDFRKTYFRNFYNNRKEGMIKGARFGKFAKDIHSLAAPIDTVHDGEVWNIDLQQWEWSTNADYMGAVSLLDAFKSKSYME